MIDLLMLFLVKKLESLQFKAAVAITEVMKGNFQESLFEESGLEKLKSPWWIKYLYCIYKLTNSGTPDYLPKMITNFEHAINTRNRHIYFLIVEQMKEIPHSEYYQRLM